MSLLYTMRAQPAEMTLAVLNQALSCQREYGDQSQPSPQWPWHQASVSRCKAWLMKWCVFFLKAIRNPGYNCQSCLCQLASALVAKNSSDRMTYTWTHWPRGWQVPWGHRGGSGSRFVGSECSSLLCAFCTRDSHYTFPTPFQWTLAFNH